MDKYQNDEFYPPTAGSTMPDVIDQLPPIPGNVRLTARVIADVIGETQWAVGKRPTGLAAVCVYVAELAHGREHGLSQQKIADRGPVSHITIRNWYRDVPALFVENASDEDIDRFPDDDLYDRIRLFAAAEDAGVAMINVDDLDDDTRVELLEGYDG